MYKRKTEHMAAFWLNKLMKETNSYFIRATMDGYGHCDIELVKKDRTVTKMIVDKRKQSTKPKKLVFEVDGKTLKYKSVRAAAEGLGVARPTLTNILNGHTKRSFALESAGIKFVGEE